MNGYPERFILKQRGKKRSSKPDEPRIEPKATVTPPYMHGLYELIKRMLEEVDIRVMVRPNTTPRKLLVKSKVPVPVECCAGIVYHIPCKDCSQTYVSQLGHKITVHQRAVKNGDTNTSAVAEHVWKHQHRMDWSASEVLDYSQQRFSRCISSRGIYTTNLTL